MQSEVICEVQNLEKTVTEGRWKIEDEANRLDQLRCDGFKQLQADLAKIRNDAQRETESAILASQ
jgi:molecular chaperone GrpE (heat shock protein)